VVERSSTTWTHWDFVLKTPRPGEAWILNGLEPKYDIYPHDDRWQGVLVHATPRGVAAFQARITRRAWIGGFTSNTPWYVPTIVRARCGRLALSAKAPRPWLVGGFLGGVGGRPSAFARMLPTLRLFRDAGSVLAPLAV
jgi:hypothetical protein